MGSLHYSSQTTQLGWGRVILQECMEISYLTAFQKRTILDLLSIFCSTEISKNTCSDNQWCAKVKRANVKEWGKLHLLGDRWRDGEGSHPSANNQMTDGRSHFI